MKVCSAREIHLPRWQISCCQISACTSVTSRWTSVPASTRLRVTKSGRKEMALPLAMVLHCAGCLIITVAAVFVCGYAESILSFLLGVLPVFVIVYAVITEIGRASCRERV